MRKRKARQTKIIKPKVCCANCGKKIGKENGKSSPGLANALPFLAGFVRSFRMNGHARLQLLRKQL